MWVWAQAFFKPCYGVQNGLRHGVHFALLQKVFASVHRGQRRRHSGKGPGGAFEQAARLQSAGGGVKKPGKPDRLPGFLNEPSAGSTGAPLGTAPFLKSSPGLRRCRRVATAAAFRTHGALCRPLGPQPFFSSSE